MFSWDYSEKVRNLIVYIRKDTFSTFLVLTRRRDLKLIVTSATMNADKVVLFSHATRKISYLVLVLRLLWKCTYLHYSRTNLPC